MTIEIPAWLLWTLGIGLGVPAAALVMMCAVIGFSLWRSFW